ncbi:hypothetical protein [Sporosarcina sp. 6E9]|uniref:hypothetical protein n=1 Tax=Sporosarcina sp. 6E9 TaxID=2819235 RepID=UPI001B3188EB|nr:hypothetical protein [Sporosarcina sp. 6E9]
MSWLLSILFILIYTYNTVPPYYYFIFGILALLFFSVSDRVAFFFYITFVLVTVFYFLFLAFKDDWQPSQQAMAIGLHFVFLLHLFSLYSLSKYMYQVSSENRMLTTRIEELEDYVLEDEVLTRREFEKRSESVLSNMRRRNETGFYLKVSLIGLKRTVRKNVLLTLAGMMHTTFRKDYDLVGQYDDTTIVVLVQNTNEQGLEVVMGRLDKLTAERLEENALKQIRWTIKKIDGDKVLDETAVVK